MPNNNPKVQFGQTLQPEPLGEWLSLVQNYAASPEALERIGVSVAALNKVQASVESLDKGTLFWTEPANMDSLLNNTAPDAQSKRSTDE